jgi:HEAT repeat protein
VSLFGPNVEKLKANKDIDGLLGVIRRERSGDKEIRTKQGAVSALCSVGIAAIPAIRDLYYDDKLSFILRHELSMSMGAVQSSDIVDMLIGALDEYPQFEGSIARSLGELGDARAVEPLMAVLQKGAAMSTISAMERLGDARAIPALLEIAGLETKGESTEALRVARQLSGDNNVAQLRLVSCWKMYRTDVYKLVAHNVEADSSWARDSFRLPQRYEHKEREFMVTKGCKACENLIKEYIGERLNGQLNPGARIGYDLGDGYICTMS